MGKHVNPDGIQSWKILRSVEQDRLGLKSVIREEKASTQLGRKSSEFEHRVL